MSLINPDDALEYQNKKLIRITEALMRKVEQKNESSGAAYAQFERAAQLEAQVRERTEDLERTLDLLQDTNAQLAAANRKTEAAQAYLTDAIETVSEGFALFDSGDRLVLSNSRFCRDLLDIGDALRPGISFHAYVELVSQSRFLALPVTETPANWARRRLERHRDDHVVFNVSLIWDRWLQVSEHRTSSGGTVVLQTDVTDIIRLERQERDKMRSAQAQLFRATLDHLNQGVCIFDREERLVGWNSRMGKLFETPMANLAYGLTFATFVDQLNGQVGFTDYFDPKALKNWAKRRIGRAPIAFEVKLDMDKTLSVFAQEMPDKGFVISFTDVTAERQAANALFEMNERLERRVEERTLELGDALAEAERANASKSRFVAAASHDLLQPLSAAKLFVAAMADRAQDDGMRDVAAKADTALTGVENIIEALLDISKLDAGKATFDVQPVRLSAVLTPLLDELGPVAAAKGLDLRVVNSDLVVESDPGFLRRIIQNLLSNAIRYTESGRVLVGARRNGGSARVEVWDTGPGIAQEDQERIFQEFQRLGQKPERGDTGLGLGLAIVERACRSLDHPLGLWSEPGLGSCFSLNVPVISDLDIPDQRPKSNSHEPERSCDDLIVLLVENDDRMATAITLIIEGWNGAVLHAHSGEEALSLLDEIGIAPDAMLIDYRLGEGMSGTEFFEEVLQRIGRVPARLISADRSKDLRQRCSELRLDAMSKPIDQDKLYTFLHAADQRKMRGF